jgi:hypothetical protein
VGAALLGAGASAAGCGSDDFQAVPSKGTTTTTGTATGAGGASTSTGAGGTSTGSGGASTGHGGSGTGGATAHGGNGAGGAQDDGGASGGAAPTGCKSGKDCDGGVCVAGACCEAAQACAKACCGAGTVCLFDACVKPGKDCHTQADCAPGQYCETALGGGGDADAGAGDGGVGCVQPLPLAGKCLDLPPVCDADAGAPGPDAGCAAACEWHPPPGPLDATARWAWGQNAVAFPKFVDVWATPTIGRVHDANCDGKVDQLDAPSVVFVSGKAIDAVTGKGTCCQCNNTSPTSCHTGVLRMLDGRTGAEIWSLDKASPQSDGFAGMSTALGDVDGDGRVDIVAVTGEGYVVLVGADGTVKRTSDKPIPGHANAAFGWGGGLAIADMDGDGFPEIAFGATVFTTTNNAITLAWTGAAGIGGAAVSQALPTFADVDGAADGHLELVAGNCVYKSDGSLLWNRPGLPDGFPGLGDFDHDGKPEIALVGGGVLYILDGATGATRAGPLNLPGTGSGGPPTVADFDGDGKPEIGVAMATYYSVLKPDLASKTISVLWKTPNHDLSSSVTGSTVFDFEGDGKAEVVYGDECFLWVFDGTTGAVRFAAPHSSFTGTEASLVADVDGDGRAELVMVANGADPSAAGWGCMDAGGNPVKINGVEWTKGWTADKGYRGITVFGSASGSWVGTRTLWNEHTYHVTNVCDDRDSACDAPNVYGSIPKVEKKNWEVPWLDDFRQNVQDKGLFDAPDATISLAVDCTSPVVAHASVRNVGLASLPAGVDVGIYVRANGVDTLVGTTQTTHSLFPGQTETLVVTLDPNAGLQSTFVAKILVDPKNPKFHECRDDNDESEAVNTHC